jgi:hypothetical protein
VAEIRRGGVPISGKGGGKKGQQCSSVKEKKKLSEMAHPLPVKPVEWNAIRIEIHRVVPQPEGIAIFLEMVIDG